MKGRASEAGAVPLARHELIWHFLFRPLARSCLSAWRATDVGVNLQCSKASSAILVIAQVLSTANSDSIPCSPTLASTCGGSLSIAGDEPDDEFLDPVTRDLIVDPVVGSDGNTYDRCHSNVLVRFEHRCSCDMTWHALEAPSCSLRLRLSLSTPCFAEAKTRNYCLPGLSMMTASMLMRAAQSLPYPRPQVC